MYRKTVLNNGVRIITEYLPHVYSVSLGVWVESGSREETPSENGITHFIEHMLFKGTERRSAPVIAKEIESVGGIINAFTSREYTFFYAKVLKEHLNLAADVLSDIVLNSLIDEKELEREKEVVCQEILMIEDNPEDHIHDFLAMSLWPENPLGMPVQGTQATVQAFSREIVRSYFDGQFKKRGIIILAVGNVGHEEVVSFFSDLFDSPEFQKKNYRMEAPEQEAGIFVKHRDIEQVHICIGLPGPGKQDPLRFPYLVMNSAVGSGMSSRLFQEAREKRGLVYSIYSSVTSYGDSGLFKIYAGTTREKVGELTSVISSVLADVKEKGITPEELRTGKEQIKGHLFINFESTDFRLTRLASNEMYYGRNITADEVSRQIDDVRGDEIQELAGAVLNPGKTLVAAIGNIDESEFRMEGLT